MASTRPPLTVSYLRGRTAFRGEYPSLTAVIQRHTADGCGPLDLAEFRSGWASGAAYAEKWGDADPTWPARLEQFVGGATGDALVP